MAIASLPIAAEQRRTIESIYHCRWFVKKNAGLLTISKKINLRRFFQQHLLIFTQFAWKVGMGGGHNTVILRASFYSIEIKKMFDENLCSLLKQIGGHAFF